MNSDTHPPNYARQTARRIRDVTDLEVAWEHLAELAHELPIAEMQLAWVIDKSSETSREVVYRWSAREKTGSSEQELRELILEEAGTRYGVWKVRFDRGEAGEAHPSIEALRDALVDFGVLQEKAAAVRAEAIPDRVVRMQVERR